MKERLSGGRSHPAFRSAVPVLVACVLGVALFTVAFSVSRAYFWLVLPAAVVVLNAVAFSLGGFEQQQLLTNAVKRTALGRSVVVGVVSAAALYGVFWVGKHVAGWILPYAAGQIDSVYDLREGVPTWIIAVVLVVVMGPGEELFWRGFVQRRLSKRFGGARGVVAATTVYALAHVATGNLILIAAATVCGLFWGTLYARGKDLMPVIISHALWDLVIFVLLPL